MVATQHRKARRSGTWVDEVARRRTEQILADSQQQAVARHVVDALQVLGQSDPLLAERAARRIEFGNARAVPEWSDPDDPLSLKYRVEVDVGTGDPIVLLNLPWHAAGLTLDQVRAEYAGRVS